MVIRTQKTSAFPLQGVPNVGLSTTKHNQLTTHNIGLSNVHDHHVHQIHHIILINYISIVLLHSYNFLSLCSDAVFFHMRVLLIDVVGEKMSYDIKQCFRQCPWVTTGWLT